MPNYRVWICFDDGLEGEVDLHELVGQGVFAAWKSIEFFNQVRVDPKTDTLSWGEEIDLDPYVLREKIVKRLNLLLLYKDYCSGLLLHLQLIV